ncbi:DUF6165 family protein [Falsiroseomonas oryzae]|uniref:DUF6165 family protein n=1 Tax=Falsiroseomonas oryzae TaxID=2766473 RepID=UPI0022EB0314|nr:DUF6165 family protein [Roseomonas sp. MO-31]
MIIDIPASPGEVLDKLTILEIKLDRIADATKRENVAREHAALTAAWDAAVGDRPALAPLRAELRAVNERLWDVEDELREHERRGAFDAAFVELARAVYRTNDRRAALKRQVNDLLGSTLREEKSYAAY